MPSPHKKYPHLQNKKDLTLYRSVLLYGENHHHIVDSCVKGLARALREAVQNDPKTKNDIPSTKGTL